MVLNEKRKDILHGILLVALFSCAAFYIGEIPVLEKLSISPLIIGIVFGMLYANSLRGRLPETWVPGIVFSSTQILRLGIILYGFRLSVKDIESVGMQAVMVDALIVCSTIFIGLAAGKMLKMDRGITLLTSIGSSICGAAAILGAESALKTKPYKTAVAVSTVVIFGTLSMFLYPLAYRNGLLGLTPEQMGVYTGATLHEVAHVVGAGNAMGGEISDTAIIVKMIRVMMLVPVLLVLGYAISRMRAKRSAEDSLAENDGRKGKISVPWFAFGFLGVIVFNSFVPLPSAGVDVINYADTFLLTMAMTALGMETDINKFKKAGPKPFLLAFILYVWLLAGGYAMVKYMAA